MTCNHAPEPWSGAYGHWRCERGRLHGGRHRYRNYTWRHGARLYGAIRFGLASAVLFTKKRLHLTEPWARRAAPNDLQVPAEAVGPLTPNPPTGDPKFVAALAFIRRTGAIRIQVRYQDDEQPVIWMVVASYPDDRHEVDASLDPTRAALRLCERLADGGQCRHCGRPTGLEPDSLEQMPLDKMICWYQYDPELRTFRRGCE